MDSAEGSSGQPTEQDVVNIDFSRYLVALRRYIWLLATIIVLSIAGSVLYTERQVPIYEATASLQIEPKLPDIVGTGDMFNLAAGGAGAAEYYRQQKEVLGSYMLAEKTIEENDLLGKLLSESELKELTKDDAMEVATLRLKTAITIRYPDQDRIFYISVRHPDPNLAMSIANAHEQTYIHYAQGLLTSNSTQASDTLQTEFNEAEIKLRSAEEKIYKFQADNDMIAVTLEERQSLVASNILAFTQKLNDSRADEIKMNAKLAEMKREANKDVLSTPIVMMGDNPSFQTLRSQYFTEKSRLIELEKDIGPKNSEYVAQKQKVDLLYSGLEGEVSILVNGTQDLFNAQQHANRDLTAEVDKYKTEAKALSPKIVVYNDLQRVKKDLEDRYNILRARLSATQMTGSMAALMSNVRPLDPALMPTRAVSPNMRVNVMIAAGLAVFVGLMLVVLLVFLDRSVKNTTDATNAAGVPVLGVIPVLSDIARDDDRARDMYVAENPNSHVAECCRSLRTNIMFSAADHQAKTIVVCSANPREGKTTTVIYLGTTMAQSGQKVLLIDTDMRRPRLHMSTGVTRERGLSNLLLGEEDYDGIVKPTEVPNLFVLPCGPLPPNPAELLMTKRFEHVLKELASRFNRIILDSPPLQVTDAVVLSKLTDGVILVVRSGKTVRDELKRSAGQLRDVNGKIFGVILNEFDKREGGGYYGYYSYYGYSSRSGDEPKKKKRRSKSAEA